MTKLQIAGVFIAAGLAAVVVQQALTNGKLREENRALAQQVSQMDDLRAENERLEARTNGSGALDEEQMKDLLRLRGQVSGLKGQLAEAQQLVERSEKAAKLAAMKSAVDPAEQQVAVAKLNFIQQSIIRAIIFAQDHKGQFPTNFDQLGQTTYSKDNVDLDASQFELVYHGALPDATNAKETIAIREKEPVRNAAGGWIRAYGFLDGHSEIHKGSDDGNFEPWENEHMQRAAGQ